MTNVESVNVFRCVVRDIATSMTIFKNPYNCYNIIIDLINTIDKCLMRHRLINNSCDDRDRCGLIPIKYVRQDFNQIKFKRTLVSVIKSFKEIIHDYKLNCQLSKVFFPRRFCHTIKFLNHRQNYGQNPNHLRRYLKR